MATQTTTVTGQQAIPTELMPYFTGAPAADGKPAVPGLLPKAQEIYSRDYATAYEPLITAGLAGQGGIAGLSPLQQQVGQSLGQMGTPSQYAAGTSAAQQAQSMYGTAPTVGTSPLQQYVMQPTQQVTAPGVSTFSMQGAGNVGAGPLSTFQMANPEAFGVTTAQNYMSPYQQMVTDVAKQEAMRDYQKSQVGANLGAARQGTYGGARNLLAQSEANRNLQTQLQGIQSRGLQDAFTNAQAQYERDRAAQMQAGTQNLQAQLGVQQLGTQTGLQAALANQQAQQTAQQQNLQAQQAAEQLRAQQDIQAQLANQQMGYNVGQQNLQALLGVQQLGSNQSLEAQKANLTAQLQAAQGLGALGDVYTRAGTAEQAADIDRLKTQGAYGDLERAYQQQLLDAQRQYLTQQAEFPERQLGSMANILRGVPTSTASQTTATTTPAPSFASQLGGLGLTGLSMYNMLK
jgi:hypothetical protein